MSRRWLAASFFALGILPTVACADDWPQFRGPNGTAVSDGKDLPTTWSAGENVRWKFKDPGFGWSSPIVWGDKVFLTTAVSQKQTKPKPGNFGFGGGMGGPPGGRGGRGGAGGFGGPPRSGEVLPSFMQYFLHLTDDQKTKLSDVQKEVDARLAKILTADQKKQLNEGPGGFAPGGLGGRGRGFGPPPTPGQVLPTSQQDRLKLTDDQKDDVKKLQKDVDTKLSKLLTESQNKQLADMRRGFGGGGGGRGGFGGRGGRGGARGGFGGFGGGAPPNDVYRWEVYCLNAVTGEVLWKQVAAERKPRATKQPSNSYASETPVTDGKQVYAYFGNTGLFCYDVHGNLRWKKDLGSHPTVAGWGTASSPALDGDRLFVQCDNEEQSFLVALDKNTGKEMWRVDRDEKTAWSSPFVWHNKVRTELVTCGQRVRSYDPATGKVLWELGSGPSGGRGGMGGPAASPVADADHLYVGLGGRMGMRTLYAVQPGATGDITLKPGTSSGPGIDWSRTNAGPGMASPLLYQGYLVILDEHGGTVSCYNAMTGASAYNRQHLPRAGGFTASPWAYDGKIFCLDDTGTTFVLQAGPRFKLLRSNKVGEMCWASVAVADGSVFLRGIDDLYCISPKTGTHN